MSDFVGLSKNLIWEKWKLINWILGIDLIALIGICLWMLIKGNLDSNTAIGTTLISFSIINFISFIMLSRVNERILTSNNYRLIPSTDTKLYLGNILTTFLVFVYLQILEGIINAIIYLLAGQDIESYLNMSGSINFGTLVQMILLIVLIPFLIWSAITLVHLLISFISGFLPFGSQRFVKFILYLIVIWAGVYVFRIITESIFKMINSTLNQGISSLSQFNAVTWIGLGVIFAWIVIISAINIYLQKRWVETIR